MKKVISLDDIYTDTLFDRPVMSVVRDPNKMPIAYINEETKKMQEAKPNFSNMPQMPAGYIKCKKHDCL